MLACLIVCIVLYTKRDIYLSLPEIRKLKLAPNPYPLVLSLSATPSRLKSIVPDILDVVANQFAHVRINLPALFRNKEPYDPLTICRLQEIPNVHIAWGGYDYGPLMKVLPTMHTFSASSLKAIVSIDDDIFYSPHLAQNAMQLANDAVYSGNIQITKTLRIPFGADVIVYPIPFLSQQFLATLEYLAGTPCRMHDDMMVAIACKSHGIPVRNCKRVRISQTREQYSSESLVASTNRDVLSRSCDAVYRTSKEFHLLN